MIFHTPYMLLLLLILPLLGKIQSRARRKRNEAALKLRGDKTVSNRWKCGLACQLGAFAALIIALARPAWNPHPGPLQMQGRDLVIALDVSRSMLAADVFPTRLDAAKIALHESLDQLQGQKISLITFAGSASVRVPLTLDHNFVRYMLERAVPSDAEIGSTSLQAAIEKAIDTALTDSKKGDQDILIFTDGEDHISNIETTAEELRESGARVLMVGIGDPVAGARVPHLEQTNTWMQYDGIDVITRLDEAKLVQLSSGSPNVIYHPAHTRPFDIIALYRKLIAETADLPVSDETRLVYTEGYPLFIALALLLWLVPLNKRLFPILALLMMAGCSPKEKPPERNTAQQIEQARELWAAAQEAVEADPASAFGLLQEAQAVFLQAALADPASRVIAEQIAGVSAQMHTVERAIQEQQEAEQDLQKKLMQASEQLQEMTQREIALSQESQRLLNKRQAVPPEEKAASAEPARIEQAAIREGTGTVLETLVEVQQTIRKLLAVVSPSNEPETEFDEPIRLLKEASVSQQAAEENLSQSPADWPPANAAFRTAAGRMQDALQLLAAQRQSQGSSDEMSDENEMEWDFDEEMEWSESDMSADMSMPMESGNFQADLEARSLPIPNYNAEDILKEEAANLEQRAKQRSRQSGAGVEKNW